MLIRSFYHKIKSKIMETKKDKFLGCLIGGAAGDALGYPVEFMRISQIQNKYGEPGITRYELRNGIAQISDDTQMTLFTANGLLFGNTRGTVRGIMGSEESYVWNFYKEWYKTQTFNSYNDLLFHERNKPFASHEAYYLPFSWLCGVDELYSRRAPGVTCLSAIEKNEPGSTKNRINNSKGCGGVMRVAPVGLYAARYKISNEDTAILGAEVAALTHGHPLGYIPAAMMSVLITLIIQDEQSTPLQTLVEQSMAITRNCFPYEKYFRELRKLIEDAIYFSINDIDESMAISHLGEGWVAEEALAIGIYCALKHTDNFEKAIIASVNHSGDSDSTGSICGNIMGAYLGLNSIPKHYTENLEVIAVIADIANDLYTGCVLDSSCAEDTPEKKLWSRKYIDFVAEGSCPRIINEFTPTRTTPKFIRDLNENEVFVFGSNLSGKHGGGAAFMALKWGAKMGRGEGEQGQTYAIPTMFNSTRDIKPYIGEFIMHARSHKEKIYLVTEIGCGIAGFTPAEIAPMFQYAVDIENIYLPESFWAILKQL